MRQIDLTSDFRTQYCQVLTGSIPYQGFKEAQIIRKLIKGEKPALPSFELNSTRAEDVVWELVEKCWAIEPKARPMCKELSQELEKKGLKRGQDDLSKDTPQGKKSFWDTIRGSGVISIDLNQVEHILYDVVGSSDHAGIPS